jgi:hypothetical protein
MLQKWEQQEREKQTANSFKLRGSSHVIAIAIFTCIKLDFKFN